MGVLIRMPELPEVETTRRGVEPYLRNQTIVQVIVREQRLRWPVPPTLNALLSGQVVRSVGRRAKYLLLEFDTGYLLIHLGMSGSLRLVDPAMPAEKHDHIDFVLADRILRYHDPRRFGAVLWHVGPLEFHPLLKQLGPEPLEAEFNGASLFKATRNKNGAIKQLLMNNRIVVGVGNIYANEALFTAGIHPTRAATALSLSECTRLADVIKQTLTRSIAAGGSTLRDFVGADSKPGYFQQTYNVYGRQDQPCRECGTPIVHIRQGQRSSYYCPLCQPC
jgi:formamidopyrimidine-DNA glycosylase